MSDQSDRGRERGSGPSDSPGGKAWLLRAALLAGSFAFVLCSAELCGRLAAPGGGPQRMLLFSENPWQLDAAGFLRFVPSRRIHTAAVYGGELEYRVLFDTNAQGFIDDRDYPRASLPRPPGRAFAVVGDSFTAGYHGGEAWVPTLRRSPHFDPGRDRLYNFGVSATGLPNYERLLAALAGPLGISEILLVAIESDFSRTLLTGVSVGDSVVMCDLDWSDADCRGRGTRIFTFGEARGDGQLLAFAAEKDRALGGGTLWRWFKDTSFLLRIVRGMRSRSQIDPQLGLDALASIRARHADLPVRLLQLPQKREVASGEFRGFRAEVEALGVEYVDGFRSCGLETEDFLPHDSHPNARGYAKIRACAAAILGL